MSPYLYFSSPYSYENIYLSSGKQMAEQLPPPPSYQSLFESIDPPADSAAVVGLEGDTSPDPPSPTVVVGARRRKPACATPITPRRDRQGRLYRACRWREDECPWVAHALWRVAQGRPCLSMTPCPLHPRCLLGRCQFVQCRAGTGDYW